MVAAVAVHILINWLKLVVLEEVATVMVLKQVDQVQAVKDLEAVTTALSFINMQRLVVVAPRPKGETL
jgi:hypothetical protein